MGAGDASDEAGWLDMQELAKFPNVFVKVSGMVTEDDWKNWKEEDFTPYLDIVFDAFGTDRVMVGSDWPSESKGRRLLQ